MTATCSATCSGRAGALLRERRPLYSVLLPASGPGSRMETIEHERSIDPGPLSLADPLLDADEAARILGAIPSKTVLQLAREGRLPSVRIGRHVRFVRAELEATLARRRTI